MSGIDDWSRLMCPCRYGPDDFLAVRIEASYLLASIELHVRGFKMHRRMTRKELGMCE
jgi:hypothetical protein